MMQDQFDIVTLIALIILFFLVIKLRSVMGRRTGDEESRTNRHRGDGDRSEDSADILRGDRDARDSIVTFPRNDSDRKTSASEADFHKARAQQQIIDFSNGNDELNIKLQNILDKDPSFDPERFVNGAHQAYELIVTAFAEGDRETLKELLDSEVYDSFISVINSRVRRGERIDQSFVGIDKTEVIDADVTKGIASITVRFASKLIAATHNTAGEVISGDPEKIKEVIDIWTFRRDLSSFHARQDPNWKLVATQASV